MQVSSLRLIALGVALAGVLVHVSTLSAGFVYDDHRFVEVNSKVRSIDPLLFFSDASSASASQGIQPDVYRPLRTLSYAIDHALFGLRPWGWHLVNLLWHGLAAGLLFRLLLPLLGGRALPAATAAVLFAVHPITSECVAWISSRGDLMAVALGLLALIVLERPGVGRTVLGAALAACACFSKESMIVLPALLPLRDLALSGDRALPRRTTWIRSGVLALVVGLYLVLRQRVIGDLEQVTAEVVGGRAALARGMLSGLVWYARELFLPRGFPFDAMLPLPFRWTDPEVVVGAGILLTVLLGGLLSRGTLRFALLGALVALVPVSNVLVPLKTLVADRFLYPSLACLVAAVGVVLLRVAPRLRPLLWGACGIAVGALCTVTWARDASWHDDATLWDSVRRDRPDNPRAYEGLGFARAREGRTSEAERAYLSYLEANPDDGKSWKALGDAWGDVAKSLYVRDVAEGEGTNVAAKRDQALTAQLGAYRAALAAWDRVGLVRGRGSEAMVRETQKRRMDAAFVLGDLKEAKAANDGLLALDGWSGSPPEVILLGARYDQRRARVTLGLQAVSSGTKGLSPEALQGMLADRALLLADLGLDRLLTDREALGRIEPLLAGLAAERPEDLVTALNHVDVLVALGELRSAREELERLAVRFPADRDVAARLGALKSR